jgi:hypothetical protein
MLNTYNTAKNSLKPFDSTLNPTDDYQLYSDDKCGSTSGSYGIPRMCPVKGSKHHKHLR